MNPFRAMISLGHRVVSPFRSLFLPRTTTDVEVRREAEYPWLEEQIRYHAGSYSRRFTPLTDNLTGETVEMRNAYRKAIAEPAVKAALVGKIGQVASLDLRVIPEDTENPQEKAIAEFCQYSLLGPSGTPFEMVWAIASGGLVDGFSVSNKRFDYVTRGRWKGRWGLTELKPKDTRMLQFEVDPYRNVIGIYSLQGNSGQLFDPRDFVHFSYLPFFNSPTGHSDLRASHRAIQTIVAALQLRMIFLDRFTGPWIKGTYRDPSTRQALETALKNARAAGYITLQEGTAVDVVDLATRGTSDFQAAIDDMRKEVAIGITGAFLQMLEGSDPGLRGNASVQKTTSEIFVWLLAVMIQGTINSQIIPDLVVPNFGPDAAFPRCQLGAVNPEDVLKDLGIDEKLHQIGLPLSKKDLYQRTGRVPPKDEGDAINPQGGASPPGPGGAPPQPPGGGGVASFAEASPPAREVTPSEFAARRGDFALAGRDGQRMRELLEASQAQGVEVLESLTRAALERFPDQRSILSATELFTPEEQEQFADALAQCTATADLLARARIRERQEKAEAAQGLHLFADEQPFESFAEASIEPLPPLKAIEYFKGLFPSIGVDPQRYGTLLKRRAFTMAVTSERTLLQRVQDLIRQQMEQGQDIGHTARDIEEILEEAGVTTTNPQYAEMVFRTNAMDAYNVGAQEEMQSDDVRDFFPVWQYLGIADGRQGKDHEPHFDQYYPNTVSFAEVRGKRPFNCRCSLRPVDRYEWEDLQSRGATIDQPVRVFSEGYLEFADRSHLVKKIITDKNGKQRTVWVNPAKDGGATPPPPPKPPVKPVVKPKPKPVPIKPVGGKVKPDKAASQAAVTDAMGKLANGQALTADELQALPGHLQNLTVPEIQAHKKQFKVLGGKVKAEHIKALVSFAGFASKNAPEPPKPPEPEPKPEPPAKEKEPPKPIDLMHRDPDHPVAKAIAGDHASHEIVKMLVGHGVAAELDALAVKTKEKDRLHNEYLNLMGVEHAGSPSRRKALDAYTNIKRDMSEHEERATEARKAAAKALIESLRPTNPSTITIESEPSIVHEDAKELTRSSMDEKQKRAISEGTEFINSVLNGGIDLRVGIVEAKDGRAFCSAHLTQIAIGPNESTEVVVHEFGHMIESSKPGVQDAANRFFAYRVEGEQAIDMGTLPDGKGLEGEMGRKDNFDRALPLRRAYYAGKIYAGGATEIISMGIEALYNNPIGFATKDPEYAQFIIGILRAEKVDPAAFGQPPPKNRSL